MMVPYVGTNDGLVAIKQLMMHYCTNINYVYCFNPNVSWIAAHLQLTSQAQRSFFAIGLYETPFGNFLVF